MISIHQFSRVSKIDKPTTKQIRMSFFLPRNLCFVVHCHLDFLSLKEKSYFTCMFCLCKCATCSALEGQMRALDLPELELIDRQFLAAI